MTASALHILGQEADGGAERPLPAPKVVRRKRRAVGSAQLVETIETASAALIAPVVLAASQAIFFWQSFARDIVAIDFAIVCALGLVVLATCRFTASAARNPDAVIPGAWIGGTLAGLIGVSLGLLPALLYRDADPNHRLLLLGTLCGAIGNVFMIGPAWPVGLAYVVPVLIGGTFGLASGLDPVSISLALLMMVGGCVVGFALDRNRKLASGHLLRRLEADEHAATIDRLLLDFEETHEEWLWEIDSRAKLRGVSPRMAAAMRQDIAAVEGKSLKTFLGTRLWNVSGDGTGAVLESIRVNEPFRNRTVAVDTSDGIVWWRLSGRPIQDELGRFAGYRGTGADITEAHDAEARIQYLANHDAATGLHNRVSFHTYVQKECRATEQKGRGGSLFSIDLDGFKAVNDRLGHAAGDEVLKEVARRLSTLTPLDAMVARLGGDEFAVWVPTCVPTKATEFADRVIESLHAPFYLQDGSLIEMGASIGIAFAPKHALDPDQLLVRADLALYRAKAEGKGQSRIFVEDYERLLMEKRSLEADVKLALVRQEFELYYQPILDIASGEVAGFETLIRWHSPTRGFVSPADFIPAAEAGGLIVPIDRWVLTQACKHAATWPEHVHVAVNISPDHFRSADLLQDVQSALRVSGLNARRLYVEVTEGVFLDKSPKAIETLHAIRRLGARIALDDFGTGYSSLSYLIDFPIDEIKIDQTFMRSFSDRHECRAIVDAILTLARKLNMVVVAEGIETAEQALALKLRRCDFIQGYLLSKPQPLRAVEAMLVDAAARYRVAVPTHVDSALGMALALKRQAS